MLDISQFITRNAIDNHSLLVANERTDFITEEVFPPLVCAKSATKAYHYDQNHLREVETRASSKAKANRVDYGVFTRDVTLELHKLAGEVDPKDEANADSPVADLEFDTAANIMERLLIKRERLMVDLVSTSSNYPGSLTATLGADVTWDSAGGDPEANAATARIATKAACGRPANALALSFSGFEKLRQSPALKDKFKFTSGQSLTEEMIKNALGVKFLHVCAAQYNNSAEGAANSLGEIWDDFALFYVKDTTQSKRSMGFGRMHIRNQLYTHIYLDNERGSTDGRLKVLEMGWEYKLQASGVVSSSDGDFIAGYMLDNIF
jgi:hypothetical protein